MNNNRACEKKEQKMTKTNIDHQVDVWDAVLVSIFVGSILFLDSM